MTRVAKWLQDYPWEFVTAQNLSLCRAKNALHKPTSDGYEQTKAFWESRYREAMDLAEAVMICRRCHRLAPFCFYNGNTFAAITRDIISQLPLQATESAAVRSLAGHIVAGVSTDEEEQAFRRFCESLDA